jgi:hypothetical protein
VTDNFILTLFQFCAQKRPEERAKRGLHQMATPCRSEQEKTTDQKSVMGEGEQDQKNESKMD